MPPSPLRSAIGADLTVRNAVVMARLFHVSSSTNRHSIMANGLDGTRTGCRCGIAGSDAPDQQGCFLCLDEREVDWFVAG